MNYIQQAYKGQTDFWMVVITTICVSGLFIANIVFVLFFGDSIDVVEEQKKLLEIIPSKNFWLAANLIPFAILLVLLFLLVKFLHKRSLLSLTTAREKVDFKRIGFAFALITIYSVGSFLLMYSIDNTDIIVQFDPLKFTILLIVSLLLFPLQIGLEEYLFRGYLMQHLGVIAKNKWLPLILTSVLFGIFHGANPEVGELGLIIMVFYIGTGLLLGIMTLMDDGLELALGFHLGNNLVAALLVTAEWSALQTDAVFLDKSTPEAGFDILFPVLIIYPIFIIILAWKYKWTGWREKLFGKVVPPPELQES